MTHIDLLDHTLPCIPIGFRKNKTTFWHPSDTEEEYNKNSKRFGTSWRYWNTADKITYIMNSFGYRSIEFTDIDNNDFFIVLGCSHTVGVGLPLEETYSYIVAEKLKIPYLNCSLGGGAANLIWTNSCLLLKNLIHKPRFVVCQWPEIMRVNLFKNDQTVYTCNAPMLEDKTIDKRVSQLYLSMLAEESLLYNSARSYFDSVNIMWNSMGVKVINITFNSDIKKIVDIPYYNPFNYPLARDCHHPGREFNQLVSEYILTLI